MAEPAAAEEHAASQVHDHRTEQDHVAETEPNTQGRTAPVGGDSPERAVPKALREIQERKDAQADGDAQQ